MGCAKVHLSAQACWRSLAPRNTIIRKIPQQPSLPRKRLLTHIQGFRLGGQDSPRYIFIKTRWAHSIRARNPSSITSDFRETLPFPFHTYPTTPKTSHNVVPSSQSTPQMDGSLSAHRMGNQPTPRATDWECKTGTGPETYRVCDGWE